MGVQNESIYNIHYQKYGGYERKKSAHDPGKWGTLLSSVIAVKSIQSNWLTVKDWNGQSLIMAIHL